METRKFEIRKTHKEIAYKNRKDIVEGCTMEDENDFVILESFANKETALEELKKYSTVIDRFSSPIGSMYGITEYCVEENIYDEDDEWIASEGVWQYTKMPEIEE